VCNEKVTDLKAGGDDRVKYDVIAGNFSGGPDPNRHWTLSDAFMG
jgi:hypothetical protein